VGCLKGGGISPLLANIYLTEVDEMLEQLKETTRQGSYTYLEYARFADDLVVLVDGSIAAMHDWRRLRSGGCARRGPN